LAKRDEKYSDEEAQQRFRKLVQAALNTPPTPLKDIPKRNGESRGGKSAGRKGKPASKRS
jgi:hypothetical protein